MTADERANLTPKADLDRLTHAYILTGGGARALAERMAAAVVCDAASGKPCGQCRQCRKALGGIHPDIIRITPEDGKAGILVGQARSLRADAYVIPNDARRKVYLIDPADKMNPQAQNALLKVLEEPPSAVTFLLLADNPSLLLDTVRSRCVELTDMSQEADDEVAAAAGALYGLIEGGQVLLLAERIMLLEKTPRDELLTLSAGMQSIAMTRLRRALAEGREDALAMRVIGVFRRVDDYLAANITAGTITGVLLEELVPPDGGDVNLK